MTMDAIRTALAYLRFSRGLKNLAEQKLSLDEARAFVRESLAQREERFLQFAEQHVYDDPRSPYLPMFHLAGCELGDLRNMVKLRGLEPTLLALREAGVYVSFEEFKGRQPIVRQGEVLDVQPSDFLDPSVRAYLETQSSGSTGPPTRSRMSLAGAFSPRSEALNLVFDDAHGLLGLPKAIWNPIPPSGAGLAQILHGVRRGQVPVHWFTPGRSRDMGASIAHRLATYNLLFLLRCRGVPVPWPEAVPISEAITVARWAAEAATEHGGCVVNTYPSLALRVSLAAQQHGLDLSGVTLIGAGEPISDAKWRGITRSGARWVPYYSITEVGRVGAGCANPVDGNDNHWLKHSHGLIQYPRPLPGSNVTVNAFYYTSLRPNSPRAILNVECDDFGDLEERHCGCPLEELGFTTHLRRIQSFAKLTAEGMTVAGTAMVRILEEVLPARFGGTALDYQLQEEEDEQGFTRLNLLIAPSVPLTDDQAVLRTVLKELRQTGPAENMSRSMWQQAQTFRVKRADPIWGAGGKFLPLVRHTVSDRGSAERKEMNPK
jgi:hypothetical protein